MRNLTYRSYVIGDLRIDGTRIYGRNGPDLPEIVIRAQLDLTQYETNGENFGGGSEGREQFSYTVTDFAGDLKLKPEAGSRSKTRSLCRLRSDLAPKHVDRQRNYTPKLVGRLTPHIVNHLEEHRQSDDLHLQVSCSLSLHFENPPSESQRFGRIQETIDVMIPHSHWTDEAYPGRGGREIFVIEIPKGKQSIQAAWGRLEEAKDAYQNWNVEGASISCREADEAVDQAVKDHYGSDSCVYTERWGRAYDGVKHQASLAGHLQEMRRDANCERPEELRVGQADLECLIIRTQSLLKYAEALLRKK
jgi:hypothetical protein